MDGIQRNERIGRKMNPGSKLITKDLARINSKLLAIAEKADKYIPGIKKNLLSGGKKLRPSLLMLAYRVLANNKSGEKYLKQATDFATVIEMLHNASLLHDDVLEGAETRRGNSTINALYGNKKAVLAGDLLTAFSMSLLYNYESSKTIEKALRIFASTAKNLVEGEIEEVTGLFKTSVTEKEYIRVVTGKTAVLFMAACEAGAVLAKNDKKTNAAMKNFGKNLGIAFQIVDDILDFTADESVLGKPVASDLLEGKITLPVIYAFKKSTPQERQNMKIAIRNIREGNKTARNTSAVQAMITKYDCIESAFRKAKEYSVLAQKDIARLPKNKFSQALKEMAVYAVERKY